MKMYKYITSIAILSLLLSACGTSMQEEKTTTGSGGNSEQNTEENAAIHDEDDAIEEDSTEEEANDAESDTEESITVGEENESDTEMEGSDKIRLMEKNLTYTVNDHEKEDTAFLRTSDNQDYSIYVLPEYEWTAEEPGSDVVYLKDDGNMMMRIQVLPENTNMDDAVNTMIEQLKAVNDEVKNIGNDNQYDWLKDATIYQSTNDDVEVTGYLMEHEVGMLKLTIFTAKDNNHTDPFIKMAETIESK